MPPTRFSFLFFLFFGGIFLNATERPYYGAYDVKPLYDASAKHFKGVNPQAPKGGKLRLSHTGGFDHLNPFAIMGSRPQLVGLLCFARLFEESPDEIGVSYPYLAKTVKISADKKTITFKLNENAAFSDKTPITARDVVWSFNYLVAASPLLKQYYRDVISAKAIDARTVEFASKNPNNKELPKILGQIFIFSERHFAKNMPESGAFTAPFPTSGAYKITKVELGKTIEFERVKDWWGEKIPANVGTYNFDAIRLDYYRDDTVAFQAFLRGDLDVWFETSAKRWNTAYDVPVVRRGEIKRTILAENKIARTSGFAFNLRREKFKDVRVREAITSLFNFQSLNKAIFYDEYSRLNSYYGSEELASEGKPSALELRILEPFKNQIPKEVYGEAFKNKVYASDLVPRAVIQKALSLLNAAGWRVKGGKLVNAKGEPFEIAIPFATSGIDKIVLALQRNLGAVGIKVIPKPLDSTTYTETIDRFDYDALYVAIPQSRTPGNEQRDFFGSKAANVKGSKNYSGIGNPAIDGLIEKLIDAETYEVMLATVHALDRVLCQNHYILLGWDFYGTRVAYFDKFGMPEKISKYSPMPIFSWWALPEAAIAKKPQPKTSGILAKLKAWFG